MRVREVDGADEGDALNTSVDDTHENDTLIGVAEWDIKRVGMVGENGWVWWETG